MENPWGELHIVDPAEHVLHPDKVLESLVNVPLGQEEQIFPFKYDPAALVKK